MEVAPFFVDFHHFLSIFTIFYRFSRFTHFCRDLHFVAIYALFPQFFLAKIAISATSHVFCMYAIYPDLTYEAVSVGCFPSLAQFRCSAVDFVSLLRWGRGASITPERVKSEVEEHPK